MAQPESSPPADISERRTAALAAVTAALLMGSYAVLKPVREAFGVENGVENLPWLFTGTMLAMLAATPVFGALVARHSPRRLVAIVYHGFAIQLVGFWLAMRGFDADGRAWTARVFFVWLSVYNLFVLSLLWSLVADRFEPTRAKRSFGWIAAGISTGAIAGPAITATSLTWLRPTDLSWIALALLELAALAASKLALPDRSSRGQSTTAVGGSAWAGLRETLRSPHLRGVAGYVLLLTAAGTIAYFMQAEIVSRATLHEADRTRLFAWMDFAVNALALLAQAVLSGPFMLRFGVATSLTLLPIVTVVTFAVWTSWPVLGTLAVLQVVRRSVQYGFGKPAQEVLLTIVPREQKYKAKSAIDTLVFRVGDGIAAWGVAGILATGLGIGALALSGIPLALGWIALCVRLGKRVDRWRDVTASGPDSTSPTDAIATTLANRTPADRPK